MSEAVVTKRSGQHPHLTDPTCLEWDKTSGILVSLSSAQRQRLLPDQLTVKPNSAQTRQALPTLPRIVPSVSTSTCGPANKDGQDLESSGSTQTTLFKTVGLVTSISSHNISRHHNRAGGLTPEPGATRSMRAPQTIPTALKRPVRILIASLGNPSPYQHTRHSAGHILLRSIQSHLGLPTLSKSKQYGGLSSSGAESGKPEWTLFRSPSLMNTSGVPIHKAFRAFSSAVEEERKASGQEIVDGLVILHDEMETAPGKTKLRRGATSAKGHNGIKSVQQSLQSAGLLQGLCQGGTGSKGSDFRQPGDRFIKIAVGIGRPEGKTRDKDDVSAYVLGQLTSAEQHGIDSLAQDVVALLQNEMQRLSST